MPMRLRIPCHDEQTAVLKEHGNGFPRDFVAEREFPRRAEAHGKDGRAGCQRALIVGVPAHAFAAVVVKVQ